MTNPFLHRHAALLALAAALAVPACTDEQLAGPPEGAIAGEPLSEEEMLATLDSTEIFEDATDVIGAAGFSIHSCSLVPIRPFFHWQNLHAKGDLRCSGSLGQYYQVVTDMQVWFNGVVYYLTQPYGSCGTSTYGCTADGYVYGYGSNYYRTRVRVIQNGGTVRTAYTGFVKL